MVMGSVVIKWLRGVSRALCLVALLLPQISCLSGGEGGDAALKIFSKRVYSPRYASGFAIYESEEDSDCRGTLLEINNPWQGAESVKRHLLILESGEQPPEGYDGELLIGHAKRIVSMSSSHVAMLSMLHSDSLVVGVSGIEFITNSYIQNNRDKVGDVGYDGNIDYEMLLSLEPDIVLMYGVFGAGAMEPKLKELGIPSIYIGDYVEQNPLGKAEWVVALGEIVGCRERAEELFNQIPERYEALCQMVRGVESRPAVMINIPYGDQWYMPSAKSYTAKLVEDAGGDYLFKEQTDGSAVIDIEEALQMAYKADVWIDVKLSGLEELRSRYPRFADIDAVNSGRVYNNDLRANLGGGNDYWESGILNPHLVLRDLIMIFHPELALEEEFSYYRRLE